MKKGTQKEEEKESTSNLKGCIQINRQASYLTFHKCISIKIKQ